MLQRAMWVSVAALCLLRAVPSLAGAELRPDLGSATAAAQWLFAEKTGAVRDGELVLDGRQRISRAFFTPHDWQDVTLSARFLVEPQPKGVLACGFIVRAADGAAYYYVHFDRTQAILVRADAGNVWNEIKRVGNLNKPAGAWHTAQVECRGEQLRVSLNGKLLFEAQDSRLKQGRVGFYGSQGRVRVKEIVIGGDPLPPAAEFVVPAPNFVSVCEDAGAGAYEAFPDVCRLSDGRLMAVFYAGYGHIALPTPELPRGGRVSCCYSSDEGRTWSPAETLFDGPDDDRDPSILQLPDGTLICNYFSLRRTTGSPKPYEPVGTFIVSSADLGKTWSAPRRISSYYCSSPIRVLSSGRLILGLYAEADQSAHGAVIFSDDKGVTWGKEVDIDNGGIRLDAETDLIELKDGTLYAALRAKMCFSTSKDRGQNWTVSKPMGFVGHCPYFLRTRDDVILLAHRLPNTSLHYSTDECATWSDNVLVDGVIGAYPSMVNLKDGTVLIVYYEEGSGSSIRARRFRATKQGIEWLTFDKGSRSAAR